ncbi:hypothetical protein [Natronorubrum halophilum]|uniref:hypothetical protein n=1 Tax=Natronorubrum halophilum TaxID=1702106 RepID=UPI0010C1754F|nr:hypothetical protein [Natronorubrum halophilum]
MARGIASLLRDRFETSDVVGVLALVAVLAVLGVGADAIGVLLVVVLVSPLAKLALERLDIHPGLAQFAFGGFAVAAGVVQLRGGNGPVGSGFLAVGAWICLDGVDRWRRGDAASGGTDDDDDVSKREVFLVGEHNRWLLEELREADRPLTAEEIQSRTGLTEDDFERLLEYHDEPGPIERAGNGYTINEDEMGGVAFVRNLVRTVGGRLLRPFRLFRPSG